MSPEERKAYYAAAQRRYKERYPERVKASYRKWREGNRKKLRTYKDKYDATYPEKLRARRMVDERVARGTIIKPKTCQQCGTKTALEGHHEDYSKPLEVIWVCGPCHRKIHGGRPK